MSTSRLKLYNGACLAIGKRSIANLTVNEEVRHLLDDVWNDGGVDFCLEQGLWKFAMRTQRLDYDTSVTTDFGFSRAFAKGADWKGTAAVCSDEFYREPLLNYNEEAGYLYASLDQIYVKFVSNDTAYGNDLARWPSSFTEYVKHYFAGRVCLKATGDKEMALTFTKKGGIVDQKLSLAKNNDAQQDPPKFPPPGNWVRARRGGNSQWRDGGSRSNLIG